MKVEYGVLAVEKLREAEQVLSRIVGLAKDRGTEWRRGAEFHMVQVSMTSCSNRPEAAIQIWLTSHSGRLGGFGIDASEIRRHKTDNKYAREFVHKILAEFKVKATRDSENPEYLRIKIGEGITLSLYGYPTNVSYKCVKQCVAILENGKEVPLTDIPIEA